MNTKIPEWKLKILEKRNTNIKPLIKKERSVKIPDWKLKILEKKNNRTRNKHLRNQHKKSLLSPSSNPYIPRSLPIIVDKPKPKLLPNPLPNPLPKPKPKRKLNRVGRLVKYYEGLGKKN